MHAFVSHFGQPASRPCRRTARCAHWAMSSSDASSARRRRRERRPDPEAELPRPPPASPKGVIKAAADAYKSKRQNRRRERQKRNQQQPPQRGRSPGPAAAAALPERHPRRAVSKVDSKASAPARVEPRDRSPSGESICSSVSESYIQGDPSPPRSHEREAARAVAKDSKGSSSAAPAPPEAAEAPQQQPKEPPPQQSAEATAAAEAAKHDAKRARLRELSDPELQDQVSSLAGVWDDTWTSRA